MKFIPSYLTIFFIVALSVPVKGNDPWTFSPIKASNETCNDAINSVKSYLVKNKYFIPWKSQSLSGGMLYPSIKLSDSEIGESYFNYPEERQSSVNFMLSGDSDRLYQGFLSSPQLMSDLGAGIMGACPNVGLVYFFYWDVFVPVGYFPDGTARTFIYATPDSSYAKTTAEGATKFMWGYYFDYFAF
jgi:hypothetical protein